MAPRNAPLFLSNLNLTYARLTGRCGKSDRRKWWDANVTPNSTGRFTLQHFIREVVNHNVQQQAMTAGLISQEDLNAWLSDNGD